MRKGLNPVRATDIALAVLAPKVDHLLARERGWSPEERWAWTTASLTTRYWRSSRNPIHNAEPELTFAEGGLADPVGEVVDAPTVFVRGSFGPMPR